MPFRVLDHTADTGIEATAETMTDLVGELATGMFSLIATVADSRDREWTIVGVEAATLADLVVDTLSELLYQAEVGDMIFCDFRVTRGLEPHSLLIEAGGVPANSVEPAGPPIKAVTYHDLAIEERDDEWYGRVYFDV